MKTKIIASFLLGLVLAGCYYDSEEELYNCQLDAAGIKYSTTLAPVFNSYGCVSCHNGSGPSGGVVLENYAGVKAAVTGGRLFGAINHNAGFSPMPQGGGKMNACDIAKVKSWIDAGAPNN
ncbi:MAG TPA: hypothetical protein VM884_05540 [Flavisolibacter sp.]|nr:hypothetical protein [Flavisolibacter sp.]